MAVLENTLFLKHESGNIGHFFNDHAYAPFAYYLKNESKIDNLYITYNEQKRGDLSKCFQERKFRTGISACDLNFNMLLLFFYNTKKPIYYKGECNLTIKTPIVVPGDRFFAKHTNFKSVFSQLSNNYKQYKTEQAINAPRVDVSILYRTRSIRTGRNMHNISLLENMLKERELSYRLFNASNLFTFFEIIDLFHNSDNVIAIHGCELTYGIFMEPNSKIIEITPKGHVERWWSAMQQKYIAYGLKYERVALDFKNKDLILTDTNCNTLCNKLFLSTKTTEK
jgi:hypothetical protein